jgi:DNA-binding transcriptional MerR regulator
MQLRIGELSRRSGVTPELLRAWERRYNLLQPERSAGGLRLYSADDLERVRRMQHHMTQGLAAREAAALATETTAPAARTAFDAGTARAELQRTLEAFDEPGGQAVIDELLAVTTVETLLVDVVLPYLRELGERWERGEVSIAQEHFASSLMRGRLLGLARGWGRGAGRRALLACAPGEHHDLGLIAFGLALRERGWRIDYLGTDTPIESIAEAAAALEPALLVLSAVSTTPLEQVAGEIGALANGRLVAVAGAGAVGFELAGILVLSGDPVAEADRVSALS